jgi:hypothetical protein
MNLLLSNVLSIYSITSTGLFIHPVRIFLHENKGILKFTFRGLCPHPASGIKLGFSGNTLDADGIKPGQLEI